MRSLIVFQAILGYEVFGSIIIPPYASEFSRAVDLMPISTPGEQKATNIALGSGDRIKRDNKYHVKCKQSGTGKYTNQDRSIFSIFKHIILQLPIVRMLF